MAFPKRPRDQKAPPAPFSGKQIDLPGSADAWPAVLWRPGGDGGDDVLPPQYYKHRVALQTPGPACCVPFKNVFHHKARQALLQITTQCRAEDPSVVLHTLRGHLDQAPALGRRLMQLAFYTACQLNRSALLQQLLDATDTTVLDVHAQEERGLRLAATHGALGALKVLLRQRGMRSADMWRGQPCALLTAAQHGHAACVAVLQNTMLKRVVHKITVHGAELVGLPRAVALGMPGPIAWELAQLETAGNEALTRSALSDALLLACEGNRVEFAHALCYTRGTLYSAARGAVQQTMFLTATQRGHPGIVNALFHLTAVHCTPDVIPANLLAHTARYGHPETLQATAACLLRHGHVTHLSSDCQTRAIRMACRHEHRLALRVLVALHQHTKLVPSAAYGKLLCAELQHACEHERIPLARDLIEGLQDCGVLCATTASNILMRLAAGKGTPAVLQFLLSETPATLAFQNYRVFEDAWHRKDVVAALIQLLDARARAGNGGDAVIALMVQDVCKVGRLAAEWSRMLDACPVEHASNMTLYAAYMAAEYGHAHDVFWMVNLTRDHPRIFTESLLAACYGGHTTLVRALLVRALVKRIPREAVEDALRIGQQGALRGGHDDLARALGQFLEAKRAPRDASQK